MQLLEHQNLEHQQPIEGLSARLTFSILFLHSFKLRPKCPLSILSFNPTNGSPILVSYAALSSTSNSSGWRSFTGRFSISGLTVIISFQRHYFSPIIAREKVFLELPLRMSKVKQKVSGCFRTEAYALAYCRISSYLQTMANKGYNPLIAV